MAGFGLDADRTRHRTWLPAQQVFERLLHTCLEAQQASQGVAEAAASSVQQRSKLQQALCWCLPMKQKQSHA
jgi:hypothetical protein